MSAEVETTALARSARLNPAWHALPWLLAIAFYFTAGGYLSLGTSILVYILLTLSLDLALGYAGILTLGHAAFFGFGAYGAALFAVHVNADPLLGLLVATAVTAVFAVLTGMAILHTQGVTLLMLTLAISVLLAEAANRAYKVTGGDDGLQFTMGPVLGLFRFDLWGQTAYLYSLAILFVWFVVAWKVVHSPFGRSLDGIRQSPARMRAIGTPVWWRLIAIYAISAAMAGSAGALSAQTTRFVGLEHARPAGLRHRGGDAGARRHAAALWRVPRRGGLRGGPGLRRQGQSVLLDVRDRRVADGDRAVPRSRADGACSIPPAIS